MALRINLYHEFIRARKQEQYDPLKLSLLGLLVIIAGMVVYYFIQMASLSSLKNQHAAQDAEFRKLSPLAKAAAEREVEMNKQIALGEKLSKRMEERFHWAPVLELLATTVPGNVQISKLTADVSAEGQRKCQILLDGIAAGEEPRKAAEDLRTALVERLGKKFKNTSAIFKNLDDSNEHVMLENQKLRTARFGIIVTFDGAVDKTAAAEMTTAKLARQP